jgi:hypothetical protein
MLHLLDLISFLVLLHTAPLNLGVGLNKQQSLVQSA